MTGPVRPSRRVSLVAVLVAALALLATACSSSTGLEPAGAKQSGSPSPSYSPAPALQQVGHVFVVNLENTNYDESFGADSTASFLNGALVDKGALLRQYSGVGHHSLPNYIAQISGQPPNAQTGADCHVYSDVEPTTVTHGLAQGEGCVYPADVPTVANQLQDAGLTWSAYQEDMGTPCRHPAVGAVDDTQQARQGDQYAARHNPFVYFHSLIDSSSCAKNDVDLDRLPQDLASVSTTANLSYLTPNLCHDGHDEPCVDGQPGGLASADAWLKRWVPMILVSPAFKKDGLLVVTFDESEADGGPAGGRVGAVVVSPFIAAGTTSDLPYDHYSLLRTIENTFDLPALGRARNAQPFGEDVFGNG